MAPARRAGDLERAALARNDRYLQEFVEALNLCPFAKRCREEGRLVRRVILDDYLLPALLRAAAEVETLPEKQCEVALFLLPGFADGPAALLEVCAEVRRHLRLFHCVAFHPALKADFSTENRAVQFLRRAPDPTLQLVRVATLDRVRGERTGGTVYLGNAAVKDLHLPPSLSEEIARANLATILEHGPATLTNLLQSFAVR
ncbi:MAG: DUF1415 domain-containing protein [Deltaproteobacteria bacterium]|nr:MAG: DUF1415 domain-containing protein [Deltaproteobacteria bacterium]TMB25025.1 MAG: DUF1415 domain-containing protein [Deltaproteobacteria bacterium]TMB34113.1 MAG: DUF1415 domain-containing protein [Deltaproteobacteria bacterium]